jgi:hypothetical protein
MLAGDGAAPRETPDFGLPDQKMMVTRGAILPLWGIILEWTLASGGSKVERHVSPRINDGGSWRRGATKDRKRVCVVLHAQGEGNDRRHGGINCKPAERLRFGLTPWRWVRGKKGGGDLWSLRTRRFLWIFLGVDDGGGHGIRPCLVL